MKQLKPDLANYVVQRVGWSSIKDSTSTITKHEVAAALHSFDSKMLKQIEDTYKNDVRKRIREGIDSPRAFMTLLRRILKRHKVRWCMIEKSGRMVYISSIGWCINVTLSKVSNSVKVR